MDEPLRVDVEQWTAQILNEAFRGDKAAFLQSLVRLGKHADTSLRSSQDSTSVEDVRNARKRPA